MNLLLVEDDAVSRMFLAEALASAGHVVRACAGAEEAIVAASAERFDRLLIDLHLGQTRGEALLRTLRSDAALPNAATPAIALTAELDGAARGALLSAGFAGVARKPLDRRALLDLVEITGRTAAEREVTTIWDDDAALAALGGRIESVRRLRGLLLAELAGQRRRVIDALGAGDAAAARAELHRLRASSAFCGAAALGDATRRLADALASGDAAPALLDAFERACSELLASDAGSA